MVLWNDGNVNWSRPSKSGEWRKFCWLKLIECAEICQINTTEQCGYMFTSSYLKLFLEILDFLEIFQWKSERFHLISTYFICLKKLFDCAEVFSTGITKFGYILIDFLKHAFLPSLFTLKVYLFLQKFLFLKRTIWGNKRTFFRSEVKLEVFLS